MKKRRYISIGFNQNKAKYLILFFAKFIFVILTFYLLSKDTSAQINNPTIHNIETFNPMNPNSNNNIFNSQSPLRNQARETNDYINQQNIKTMQQMGNTPPVVPPSDPYLQHQFILNQYKQNISNRYKQQREIFEILNEVNTENFNKNINSNYYNNTEFLKQSKTFYNAFNQLNDMLSNKKQASIANAYFSIESAYGDTYLSEKEYNKQLTQSADFIKQWLIENGYKPNKNEDLHYGLQQFMKDTLTISIKQPENNAVKTMKHTPFTYDYNDFKAEKDHRNYFITKCLATGTGQCNSLPGTYLAIAEKLGAKTFLIFAPQHSFVKYPDSKGALHGYEPTSNWKISDKWYVENLGILPEAIRSGIYLDTLNKQMIIANCMLDLAFAYMKKFGAADGKFVTECINTAMQYYPRKNNITAYFLRSSLLAHQLDNLLRTNGIMDIKDMNKVKGAKELYVALMQNEELIQKLGYQQMPEAIYQQLMQNHEFKGKLQQNINTRQKRNLFSISTN